MANKTQTKAVIDAAVVTIKSRIDNILPVGVDITDGAINFGPTRWTMQLNAGGSQATADSLAASIQTGLTGIGVTSSLRKVGRRGDDPPGHVIEIVAATEVYRITNW